MIIKALEQNINNCNRTRKKNSLINFFKVNFDFIIIIV